MLFLSALVLATPCRAEEHSDYTQGVFIVNEDWYGHQNSTVNYLRPDDPDGEYWEYRVFQTENPGHELGCTNQYGAIHNGRFYLIAKQDKDPGASVAGGRITVADASTMKMIKQLQVIDPYGAQCDGRAFIGIDEHKGYISTSNGVWIFDLDKLEVTGQIPGTGNPNAGDDKNPSNPSSSLYYGQCGSMVISAGNVYVAHQSAGVLVIDPATDTVIQTLTFGAISDMASVGSVVVAKDGSVWASVAKDATGTGATEPYLVEIDPHTFVLTLHELPEDIYAPANSWYAWTPDGFCASTVRNALYWNGGANSWFSQQKVFRYDIDADRYEQIIDLKEEGDGWNIYGCSMRLHPVTDELYMSLFVKFVSTTYTLRRCDYMGRSLQEYPMIANYWFPSLPVFPQSESAGIEAAEADAAQAPVIYYDLQGRSLSPTSLPPGIVIRRQGATATKLLIR